MSEGTPNEDVLHDTEVVVEVKENTETIADDFSESEPTIPTNNKTVENVEIEAADQEKVDAISSDIKEHLSSFEDDDKPKEDIVEGGAEKPVAKEVKKIEKKKDNTHPFLKFTDTFVGIPLALGASMFKRVGNFYQKMKSFFTGKPVPQAKK